MNEQLLAEIQQLANQFKNDFANKTSNYSPEQSWELGYRMLEIIWKIFDSFPDYFDFELPMLRQLHANQLTEAQKQQVFEGIDNARFEYYLSLNETGELAFILATHSTLTQNQLQQVYKHYLQVGMNNFSDDELKKWANMELLSV